MNRDCETCIVGITGQVGSGKSTFAKMICRKSSAIINADLIARDIVNNSNEIQNKIRKSFGENYFDDDGQLKRRELGKLVFSNPEQLNQLNLIIWPDMIQRIQDEISLLKTKTVPNIILDMAVLFETNLNKLCDYIIAVIAPDDMRMIRLKAEREWQQYEIVERQNNQKTAEFLQKNANIVVCNDGSLNDLKMKADAVIKTIFQDGNGVC